MAVSVLCLFLTVSWFGLRSAIVAFPGHIHLLFYNQVHVCRYAPISALTFSTLVSNKSTEDVKSANLCKRRVQCSMQAVPTYPCLMAYDYIFEIFTFSKQAFNDL